MQEKFSQPVLSIDVIFKIKKFPKKKRSFSIRSPEFFSTSPRSPRSLPLKHIKSQNQVSRLNT